MSAVTLADIARAAVEQGLDAEAVADRLFEDGPAATNKYALRDRFAATALPVAAAKYEEGHPRGWLGVAECAYAIADAMLKARQA